MKMAGSDTSRESFCGYCLPLGLGNAQKRVFAEYLGDPMAA